MKKLKLNIQKTKVMASSPITSWQIDGETMETVRDFIWGGGSKSLQMVTATTKLKDTCSLGKKVMTNLDSILKSRDVTLLTKVHLVKATVFPVVTCGCESWAIKCPRYRLDNQHSRSSRFQKARIRKSDSFGA